MTVPGWVEAHPFLTFFFATTLVEAFVKALPFMVGHPVLAVLLFVVLCGTIAVVAIVRMTTLHCPRCIPAEEEDQEEED